MLHKDGGLPRHYVSHFGGDRPMGVPPGEPNMYPGDWGDIVSVGLSLTKASWYLHKPGSRQVAILAVKHVTTVA